MSLEAVTDHHRRTGKSHPGASRSGLQRVWKISLWGSAPSAIERAPHRCWMARNSQRWGERGVWNKKKISRRNSQYICFLTNTKNPPHRRWWTEIEEMLSSPLLPFPSKIFTISFCDAIDLSFLSNSRVIVLRAVRAGLWSPWSTSHSDRCWPHLLQGNLFFSLFLSRSSKFIFLSPLFPLPPLPPHHAYIFFFSRSNLGLSARSLLTNSWWGRRKQKKWSIYLRIRIYMKQKPE